MSDWNTMTGSLGRVRNVNRHASCRTINRSGEWRHLDTCQYQTILHAELPRSECREHGVRVVKMPWAEPSSRFTALFEALAIELNGSRRRVKKQWRSG